MASSSSGGASRRNFILQQGLPDPAPESCAPQYAALHFQPRVVGVIVALGIVLQQPAIFLALGAVLAWSAALPRWNPFDALYNATLGARPGAVRLSPAPPPRRFSQGMAATFALGVGVSLLAGWAVASVVLQLFLVVALLSLVLGRFCLGSFLFYVVRGKGDFARRTLPWAQGA